MKDTYSGESSGLPEFRSFGQKGKFSAFGLWFRPPKLKTEYGRNSRKALDFLLFVHENIANVIINGNNIYIFVQM